MADSASEEHNNVTLFVHFKFAHFFYQFDNHRPSSKLFSNWNVKEGRDPQSESSLHFVNITLEIVICEEVYNESQLGKIFACLIFKSAIHSFKYLSTYCIVMLSLHLLIKTRDYKCIFVVILDRHTNYRLEIPKWYRCSKSGGAY